LKDASCRKSECASYDTAALRETPARDAGRNAATRVAVRTGKRETIRKKIYKVKMVRDNKQEV
jgi:hypothetical protein